MSYVDLDELPGILPEENEMTRIIVDGRLAYRRYRRGAWVDVSGKVTAWRSIDADERWVCRNH